MVYCRSLLEQNILKTLQYGGIKETGVYSQPSPDMTIMFLNLSCTINFMLDKVDLKGKKYTKTIYTEHIAQKL